MILSKLIYRSPWSDFKNFFQIAIGQSQKLFQTYNNQVSANQTRTGVQ